MGSPLNAVDRANNEIPHHVILTHSFEIQSTPVTQLQWYLVMGNNPSKFSKQEQCDPGNYPKSFEQIPAMCKHHPVETVSWDDTQEFIQKLNQLQSTYTYRLPTEAEWEYVAHVGLPIEYPYGWGYEFDPQYGWYVGNSGNRTHAVATKIPTPSPQNEAEFLYDMAGNVWEWVQDVYGEYSQGGVPGITPNITPNITKDPRGPSSGSSHVIRGGCWSLAPRTLRPAHRGVGAAEFRSLTVGFRLARTVN